MKLRSRSDFLQLLTQSVEEPLAKLELRKYRSYLMRTGRRPAELALLNAFFDGALSQEVETD